MFARIRNHLTNHPASGPRRLAGLTLVFAGVALVSATLLGPRPVEALPSSSLVYTYYSDASYQTEVGFRIVYDCFGAKNVNWGMVTSYRLIETDTCN